MAEKHRYFIRLAYNGKAYHGWQRQENVLTVQELMEEKLSAFFGEDVAVVGAGRTDTGVHARDFYAHFDLQTALPHGKLPESTAKLNNFFPRDIAILDIFPVAENAHARFSATARTYEYHISRRKDPFMHDLAWHYHGELDVAAMNEAAAVLKGYEDFTSFSKLHTQVKTNICQVSEAVWSEEGHKLVFTIRADRFLRNMVRAIVGTLVELGRGKTSIREFKEIIEARNRSLAGRSAPAHGLFLTKIEYPGEILKH